MSMYNTFDDDFITDLRNWCKQNPINITDYCEPLNIQKGEMNSFYGQKHTEESKLKISLSKTGVSVNKGSNRPWAKDNLKCIKSRAFGKYEIVEPDGKIIEVINLKKYCSDNSISYTSMSSLANGKYPANVFKGYRCKKLGYIKIRQ